MFSPGLSSSVLSQERDVNTPFSDDSRDAKAQLRHSDADI
jgi:hypothetical protein